MMILREAIQQISGLRYMMEQLNISSSLGRRFLYETCWLTSQEAVDLELARIEALCGIISQSRGEVLCERLVVKLMQARDIRGTVKRTGDMCVLDDLELFELKNFALLANEIQEIVSEWDFVKIPDLGKVITLLDPENSRIPHFYIYDAYSEELAAIRKLIKEKKQQGNQGEAEELYAQSLLMEDRVREKLSLELRAFHGILYQALHQVAWLDVALAKTFQVRDNHLVRPEIAQVGGIVFKGLFNPQVQNVLRETGKNFQPVDIQLKDQATLITGANMAGKTVLLKSVALAQYLMQFGFFVPATQARMMLVDEIEVCIGDEQDELNGLSSYAAEMLRINEIVIRVKAGRKVLVLIDELARTTNPVEGKAIVNGVVEFFTNNATMALVTTHYSGITAPCRKLRVKGFMENRITGGVTLSNINDFIDYSLLEDEQEEVPHEAIRIARMLGIDSDLLSRTENYLREDRSGHKQTVQ